MKRFLCITGIALVTLYLAALGYVAATQDRFLYQPTHESEAELLKLAAARGMQPLRASNGEIEAWGSVEPSSTRRMLIFHGGSGHALQRTFYADAFRRLGWEVSLFEYPGFGARSGEVGKRSFLAAAEAFVRKQLAADQRPLFLVGESMGSGTACAVSHLTTSDGRGISGLALVVPYARMAEVARRHLPLFPIDAILRDKYDNLASLERFSGPVAVVIADADEVVGQEQGRKVYDHYGGPKHLIVHRNCHHADFPNAPDAPWWTEVSRFLTREE